eukprot:TRINITY_DN12808_c0_g1_i2.p1 TRINITY_DN12808_c0_g1~~TRINITY_DN12808_c0_g1_i2.p1  ORF type:complete len:328 (-),score=50.85 TRINITY_DN12808_c0_g1_i2:229-1212(-)
MSLESVLAARLDLLDTLALRELTTRRSEITERLYLSISRQTGSQPFLSNLAFLEKHSSGWYHFELITKAVALGLAGLRSLEDDSIQLSVAALLALLMALILTSKPLIKQEQAAASMITYASAFLLLLIALICRTALSKEQLASFELVFFILSLALYGGPALLVLLDLEMLMNRSKKYMHPDVNLEEFLEDYAFRLTPKEGRQWMTPCGDVDGVISTTCPVFCWSCSAPPTFFQKCFSRCCKSWDTTERRWTYDDQGARIVTIAAGTDVLPLVGGSSSDGDCIKARVFINGREKDLWLPTASLTASKAEAGAADKGIEMTEASSMTSS